MNHKDEVIINNKIIAAIENLKGEVCWRCEGKKHTQKSDPDVGLIYSKITHINRNLFSWSWGKESVELIPIMETCPTCHGTGMIYSINPSVLAVKR